MKNSILESIKSFFSKKNGIVEESPKPTSASLILLNSCVLNCKMCKMWRAPRSEKEITAEEWKKFIILLKDLLVEQKEIIFSGGEPLLKKELVDLVNFASNEGFRTLMPTNGWLVTEDIAERLNKAGLNEVFISLDSYNPETHDFLRGKEGAFERVMRAIEFFDKYRRDDFRISFLTVISGRNLDDIIQLLHIMHKDKRISGVYFQAIAAPFFTGEGIEWFKNEEYSYLWPGNYGKAAEVVDEIIRLKVKENYIIHNHSKQLENFKKYFENPLRRVNNESCYLGDYVINVDHEGNINLCCFQKPVGNIRRDDIRDLWFSDKLKSVRDEMHNCKINCHNMVNCFFKE